MRWGRRSKVKNCGKKKRIAEWCHLGTFSPPPPIKYDAWNTVNVTGTRREKGESWSGKCSWGRADSPKNSGEGRNFSPSPEFLRCRKARMGKWGDGSKCAALTSHLELLYSRPRSGVPARKRNYSFPSPCSSHKSPAFPGGHRQTKVLPAAKAGAAATQVPPERHGEESHGWR